MWKCREHKWPKSHIRKKVSPISHISNYMAQIKTAYEEIESRLNLGKCCYHSVQNAMSWCLLSKNVKIKIYKTIILSLVLYGRETWISR